MNLLKFFVFLGEQIHERLRFNSLRTVTGELVHYSMGAATTESQRLC